MAKVTKIKKTYTCRGKESRIRIMHNDLYRAIKKYQKEYEKKHKCKCTSPYIQKVISRRCLK